MSFHHEGRSICAAEGQIYPGGDHPFCSGYCPGDGAGGPYRSESGRPAGLLRQAYFRSVPEHGGGAAGGSGRRIPAVRPKHRPGHGGREISPLQGLRHGLHCLCPAGKAPVPAAVYAGSQPRGRVSPAGRRCGAPAGPDPAGRRHQPGKRPDVPPGDVDLCPRHRRHGGHIVSGLGHGAHQRLLARFKEKEAQE